MLSGNACSVSEQKLRAGLCREASSSHKYSRGERYRAFSWDFGQEGTGRKLVPGRELHPQGPVPRTGCRLHAVIFLCLCHYFSFRLPRRGRAQSQRPAGTRRSPMPGLFIALTPWH